MYVEKIARILINGDEYDVVYNFDLDYLDHVQEHTFVDNVEDLELLLNSKDTRELTKDEIKQAITMLESGEIDSVCLVYKD